MKIIKQICNPLFGSLTGLAAFLISFTLLACSESSYAQNKRSEQVKVKIVKIVDGKTTTIEKTMDEASVKDFTKQFDDIEGKDVQVMVTIEGTDNCKHKSKGKNTSCPSSCNTYGKNNCASSMHFNFDMDSSTARSFSKMFRSDSSGHPFVWNDSMMKSLPKNFDFNFNFDDAGEMNDFDFDINTDTDGKTVIIKNKAGKTIVINGDDETVTESESQNGNRKTKTKTIVINDDKTKSKKKVIVSTSVMVIDMDEDSGKRKSKEEDNFSFYPNPSDGNFVLNMDLTGKEDASVRIIDLNGKEVYNDKVTGTGKISKTINLGADKKGTFIVTIRQGKKTTSKKIIIE